MGGYIAQELAINYPEMVQGLILGCTGPRKEPRPAADREIHGQPGIDAGGGLEGHGHLFLAEKFIQENPEEIREFVEISMRYYQPPDAHSYGSWPPAENTIPSARLHRKGITPALPDIMTGDDDPLVPPRNFPYPEEK